VREKSRGRIVFEIAENPEKDGGGSSWEWVRYSESGPAFGVAPIKKQAESERDYPSPVAAVMAAVDAARDAGLVRRDSSAVEDSLTPQVDEIVSALKFYSEELGRWKKIAAGLAEDRLAATDGEESFPGWDRERRTSYLREVSISGQLCYALVSQKTEDDQWRWEIFRETEDGSDVRAWGRSKAVYVEAAEAIEDIEWLFDGEESE
jgi:hypothetical protein